MQATDQLWQEHEAETRNAIGGQPERAIPTMRGDAPPIPANIMGRGERIDAQAVQEVTDKEAKREASLRARYNKNKAAHDKEIAAQRAAPVKKSSSGWIIKPKFKRLDVPYEPFEDYKMRVDKGMSAWRKKRDVEELNKENALAKIEARKADAEMRKAEAARRKAEADRLKNPPPIQPGWERGPDGKPHKIKPPSAAEKTRRDKLNKEHFMGSHPDIKQDTINDTYTSAPMTEKQKKAMKAEAAKRGLTVYFTKGEPIVEDKPGVFTGDKSTPTFTVSGIVANLTGAQPEGAANTQPQATSNILYKWKDKKGQTQVTDHPGPGQTARPKAIEGEGRTVIGPNGEKGIIENGKIKMVSGSSPQKVGKAPVAAKPGSAGDAGSFEQNLLVKNVPGAAIKALTKGMSQEEARQYIESIKPSPQYLVNFDDFKKFWGKAYGAGKWSVSMLKDLYGAFIAEPVGDILNMETPIGR